MTRFKNESSVWKRIPETGIYGTANCYPQKGFGQLRCTGGEPAEVAGVSPSTATTAADRPPRGRPCPPGTPTPPPPGIWLIAVLFTHRPLALYKVLVLTVTSPYLPYLGPFFLNYKINQKVLGKKNHLFLLVKILATSWMPFYYIIHMLPLNELDLTSAS